MRHKNFLFLSVKHQRKEIFAKNLQVCRIISKTFLKTLRSQNYGFPPILENRKFAFYWSTKRITYPKEIFAGKEVDGQNANETGNKMNLNGNCNPGNATRKSTNSSSLELIFARKLISYSYFFSLFSKTMKQECKIFSFPEQTI